MKQTKLMKLYIKKIKKANRFIYKTNIQRAIYKQQLDFITSQMNNKELIALNEYFKSMKEENEEWENGQEHQNVAEVN